jgi:hypothetical protein
VWQTVFFTASSSRTTDILVGQIHLADAVGIARENRGDGGDLEDEAGRSEVGVGGIERGGLEDEAGDGGDLEDEAGRSKAVT